jgi:D-arginine dehydrogenase
LIVGAGMAGASLAYELGDAHAVTLLESEDQPGYHATGRSAAFFSEIYGNETIRALTAASREFFGQPPAVFDEHPLLEPRDCVVFAGRDDLQALRAQFAELRHRVTGLSLESADFALERVPVLRRSKVAGCLWESASQRIDVHALLQGYLRGFRRRRGRLVTRARVEAARRRGGVWSVETTAGEFRARVLVNAAGAWADRVAALAGAAPLGLQPLRRTVCVIETETAEDCADWAAVTDLDESFYCIPEAGRLLLSPADETPSPAGDAYPEDLDVAIAVDRLEAVTTLQVRRVVQQWAGLRTFASDRIPVVGFDPRLEGFFWCAGQGGYGAFAPGGGPGQRVRSRGLAAGCRARPTEPKPLRRLINRVLPKNNTVRRNTV